jgi:hypothetical protein
MPEVTDQWNTFLERFKETGLQKLYPSWVAKKERGKEWNK